MFCLCLLQDLQTGYRVISQLHVGTSWINNYNLAPVELPWTGQKGSGIGGCNGSFGVDDWTQLKSVYVEMDKVWCAYN
jgi:betaine-aldehyde dehydrogenase